MRKIGGKIFINLAATMVVYFDVMSSASMLRCLQKCFLENLVFNVRTHWRFTKPIYKESQNVKYLLVLDFEATCEERNKITQEIIEFPCLKLNTKTFNVDAVFHEYVRPVENKQLPAFCIELTGIVQDMVDGSDPFPMVFRRFEEWRRMNDITAENSAFVTSGDWDLGKMLPNQCQLSDRELPAHYQSWIDLKKLYGRQTGHIPKSLIEMIHKCGLTFQGRQHSGIDDCLNIANILRYIGQDRELDLRPTSFLKKSATGFKVHIADS